MATKRQKEEAEAHIKRLINMAGQLVRTAHALAVSTDVTRPVFDKTLADMSILIDRLYYHMGDEPAQTKLHAALALAVETPLDSHPT